MSRMKGRDADLTQDSLTLARLTPDQLEDAAWTVAGHAVDAAELDEFLHMLGIRDSVFLHPLTPSGRAAATPHGAAIRKARRQRKEAQ